MIIGYQTCSSTLPTDVPSSDLGGEPAFRALLRNITIIGEAGVKATVEAKAKGGEGEVIVVLRTSSGR